MLQPVEPVFKNVLQGSMVFYNVRCYDTRSDDMEGMYGNHVMRHVTREYEGK